MKNQYFCWFSGVEVGTKIDQKSIRTWTPRRGASFCGRKRVQDVPRTSQDALKTLQDASATPQDAARRSQDAAKTPQDAPRRSQDGPKTAPRRPKTLQDGGKIEPQKRSEAQSSPDLGFGAFWDGFWSVLGWIVERFWNGFSKFFAPQRSQVGFDFGSIF